MENSLSRIILYLCLEENSPKPDTIYIQLLLNKRNEWD